jgi:hypothetical protein
MAIAQHLLRDKSRAYGLLKEAREKAANAALSGLKMAFLCHSHKDEDLVKGLVVLFQELGITLYVDWQDNTMPEKPNSETAKKIQDRIIHSDIFLFLATANSKASRWCPWEIGFADSGDKKIYIIPTTDGYNSYGNEYLDLYPKIDTGTYRIDNRPGYFVFHPNLSEAYAVSNDQLL